MDAVQLANALGRRRTGIHRCLNCADIAADHNRHQAAADLLLANQVYVCSLNHSIGCFNRADQASGLYHTECFFHVKILHRS